jgi:hypothetical protein
LAEAEEKSCERIALCAHRDVVVSDAFLRPNFDCFTPKKRINVPEDPILFLKMEN